MKGYLQVEEDPQEMSRYEVLNKLLEAVKLVDARLIRSLDEVRGVRHVWNNGSISITVALCRQIQAESRFFDTIPFGITSCKEWLANKAQKFPLPKT